MRSGDRHCQRFTKTFNLWISGSGSETPQMKRTRTKVWKALKVSGSPFDMSTADTQVVSGWWRGGVDTGLMGSGPTWWGGERCRGASAHLRQTSRRRLTPSPCQVGSRRPVGWLTGTSWGWERTPTGRGLYLWEISGVDTITLGKCTVLNLSCNNESLEAWFLFNCAAKLWKAQIKGGKINCWSGWTAVVLSRKTAI